MMQPQGNTPQGHRPSRDPRAPRAATGLRWLGRLRPDCGSHAEPASEPEQPADRDSLLAGGIVAGLSLGAATGVLAHAPASGLFIGGLVGTVSGIVLSRRSAR